MNKMAKSWALVTGGSSGIGLELAKLLAQEGQNIVLVARDQQKLIHAQKTLIALGAEVQAISMDLSEVGAADRLQSKVEALGISIHTLINNAGFGVYDKFLNTEPAKIQGMIMLSVVSFTELAHRFIPAMIQQGSGRVLNVASTSAFQAGPGAAVYSATNAYELHFSEALAKELEGTGVAVTCLCPGPTATEFQQRTGIGKPGWPHPDAATVARSAHTALRRGKSLVIPGWHNVLGTILVRLLPRRVVTWIRWQYREHSGVTKKAWRSV